MSVDENGKVVNFDCNKWLDHVLQELLLLFYSTSNFVVDSSTIKLPIYTIKAACEGNHHLLPSWIAISPFVVPSEYVMALAFRDGNPFGQAQLNRESANQNPSNFSQALWSISHS
ncbi:uncharacterized protein LOC141836242 [Curcuma longa]|uniref:uncharacterized protein LOC141836242 n=1 Tax=Curcuma longa TaxID=136217 RepID=UPI003D9F201F